MIPIPWMIVGAVVMSMAAYLSGHHTGWSDRDAEMQAEIASKNEEIRKTEHKLNEQLAATSTELKDANDAIAKKESDITRLIKSGGVRLPSASCVQAASGSSTSSGNQQNGAESDRQVLELIAQIISDGDRAINQLNACIAAYEQVREAANGNK
jgi:uncharacterized phage infection (PIP) family protein YhgE